MMRRALIAAACAALMAPAGASASTLGIGTGSVAQYTGAAGEANHLVISYNWFQGTYLFTDTGASAITITGTKSPCHASSAQVAYCPWGSLGSINVQLGNGGSYGESQLMLTPVTMRAGTGDDTLIGGGGADTLIAGPGHDTLKAGRGNTTFTGGTGPSTMTGGPGKDTFNGGAGSETIDSRDGVAENVTCGAGTDLVTADPDDVVAADCEQVDRGIAAATGATTAIGGSTSTATGTDTGAGSASTLATATAAQVLPAPATITSANVLPLKVACPAGVAGGCRGTLTVTLDLGPARHKAAAARRRKLIVARHKAFAVAAGRTMTVRVPLNRRSVRVFRRKGRVSRTRRFKVQVTVATRRETGVIRTTRTVTVRPARRRPRATHGRR